MTDMDERELADYEKTVSAELATIGFVYYPHHAGGGYYWHREYGLQLTDDLAFYMRGSSRIWTLKRIDGLKIYDRTFSQKKRSAATIGKEIVGKLAKLLANTNWREIDGWNLTDLSK